MQGCIGLQNNKFAFFFLRKDTFATNIVEDSSALETVFWQLYVGWTGDGRLSKAILVAIQEATGEASVQSSKE